MLYLTPDAPLNSGTSLCKPNKNFVEKKYLQELDENSSKFRAGEISMDTRYHSMFDEIVRVNNVYNTLILYEGQHYHAAKRFSARHWLTQGYRRTFLLIKLMRKSIVFFHLAGPKQLRSSFKVMLNQLILN